MKVGIYGYGHVGQAVHATITSTTNVAIYDPNIERYADTDMDGADILFICTPDIEVVELLESLVSERYRGVVVVKSTSSYGILNGYEGILKLVHNPEFLNQNTFIEDSLNQSKILLGGRYDACKEVADFYMLYTKLIASPVYVTLKQACDFKVIRNVYGAYKVLFWEFVQDTTGNARKMSELYKYFPQPEMSQVGMDAERGYGGACFPKDVRAWDNYFEHDLTKFMIDYNEELKK